MYDECNSFCCGGQVILNSTHLDCCGSRDFGSPYSKRYERCCEWWTGHGRAHSKRSFNYGSVGCCGASVIDWGRDRCCYGDSRIVPSVFYYRRQKCCGGRVIPISRTLANHWDAGCCGTTSTYDKRRQSCPCDDGQVVDAPSSRTGCCRSPYGGTAPYIPDTQICCNGVVGNKTNNFCCDNLSAVGVVGESVCCGGNLVTISPPNANLTECCNGSPYDPRFNVCCNSDVLNDSPSSTSSSCCGTRAYDTSTSICCDGQIFDKALGKIMSSSCCNGSPYFPSSRHICCGNGPFGPFATPRCCGGEGFDIQGGTVCCGGRVYEFNNRSPSCCVDVGYDVTKHTCCGSSILPNPHGTTEASCCGSYPYDRKTELCCQGTNVTIPANSACCGAVIFNTTAEFCCEGRLTPKTYTQSDCCAGRIYNREENICCRNELQPVGVKVGFSRAECCGGRCYFRGPQSCCNERIYMAQNAISCTGSS
uniref:Galaxin-like repeats domain-containing protein n=1 Tax=Ciona intestinalis TaxID=7719 RepID=F6WNF1_CIOIN